jgi:hypothetical protein
MLRAVTEPQIVGDNGGIWSDGDRAVEGLPQRDRGVGAGCAGRGVPLAAHHRRRDAEAGETTLAFTTLLLILVRTGLTRLPDLMPDGHFEYLVEPGVLPACLSEFVGDVAGGRTTTA